MGKVVNMDDHRKSRDGWLSGVARCYQCKHMWVEVKPADASLWTQCPRCGAEKGFLVHPVEKEGDHWMCDCGCDVFHLTRYGPYCPICGRWNDQYLREVDLE